jgi:ABC-type dipeptide/oligopeptide/nickel transport system permease component
VLPLLSRAFVRLAGVLLGVSLIVFLIVHAIPGDPAVIAAGLEASPDTVARMRRDLGLDRPLPEQFVTFLTRAAQADFGVSIRTGTPVRQEIVERMPHTIRLAVGGTLLAAFAGVTAGVLAAFFRRRTIDRLLTAVTMLAVSMPSYWLALMLMLAFSLQLGLLPSIGVGTPAHLVLPILTLATYSGGLVCRMTRAAMLDTLGEDFIRTARSKGVPESAVAVRHALANALVPIVTLLGLRFGGLLAGTVLVESVFAIPGVGRMMVDAVLARDFPMVQGGVLVVATLYVITNTATDVVAQAIDPRVRA